MNTIPDLIPLHDNRRGLRSLLQVEVREASGATAGGGELSVTPCLDFVASTATLDRYQEVIEPVGWRLESYRRNPVFQNAHNYGDILFTLGKALTTEVRVVGGKPALCQRIEFATEVNPVARIAYGLYKGGFLNAVSVGFIPLKWEDGGEERGAEEAGALERAEKGAVPRRRYLEQELLEVSAVAIPANPDALALGVKSGAVAKDDLRDALELLRAIAGAEAENPSPLPSPAGRGGIDGGPLGERALPSMLHLARELRRVMQKA